MSPHLRKNPGGAVVVKLTWLLPVALLAFPVVPTRTAAATAEQVEFFERRIRPVLAQECYECHSTAGKQKGGLVLDHRQALLRGGESGPVVLPGQPDASLLLQAIRQTHASLKMPRNGAPLEPSVVADFAKWIEDGAIDPREAPPSAGELAKETDWAAVLERRKQWWSLRPVVAVPPPGGVEAEWAARPIDAFVRSRAVEAGLPMAPLADRRTLIRRVSYVLTGLPPSPEEVEAFLQDESPQAWSNLVDRLLAAPAFGERWARHWMDWVRYAETHGSEGDPPIPHAWRYRDYLVRAWNADVPYPQLVREAVAGDLLPAPRINVGLGLNESALGTAQLRFVLHGFTPTDALDEQVTFTDNQIDTLSKAFLGLTVSCARCHNHKFDAISQTDFYAFYGIMMSGRPALIDVNAPDLQTKHVAALVARQAPLREALAESWLAQEDTLPLRLEQWAPDAETAKKLQGDGRQPLSLWLSGRQAAPAGLGKLWLEARRSWEELVKERKAWNQTDVWQRWDLRKGDASGWTWEGPGLKSGPINGGVVVDPKGEPRIQRIAVPGRTSDVLSGRHRGICQSPAFEGKGGQLWLRVAGQGGAVARYAVRNYPKGGTVYPLTKLDQPESARPHWISWNVDYWKGDRLHLEITTAADQPVQASAEDQASWFSVEEAVYPKDAGSRPPPEAAPLLALLPPETSAPPDLPSLARCYSNALKKALQLWRSGEADEDALTFLNTLLEQGLLGLPEQSKSGLAEYAALSATVPLPTRIAGLLDGDAGDRPLFVRGDHHQPGDVVPRRFLEALDRAPYDLQPGESGRLPLAESLAGTNNPLLARVIVNRLWHHVFGRGIVATTDNFGRLGSAPTHPALLDWLASDFLEHGGSLKHTIREMVLSRAFRSSHLIPAGASDKDPANLLLTHWSPRRLEAEAVRDTILQLAGTLDRTPGGPSVDGGVPRRSLYVKVMRNQLDPFLSVFDAPVPSATRGNRDATNVPDQALTLLNNPLVLDSARRWSSRIQAQLLPRLDQQDLEKAGIERFYLEGLGRPAEEGEIQRCREFLHGGEQAAVAARAMLDQLENSLEELRKRFRALLASLRNRAAARADRPESKVSLPSPRPWLEWDFADSGQERDSGHPYGLRSTPLTFVGGARVEGGALQLNGRSSAALSPLLDRPLGEKTLLAWVKLDGLSQRGGGVVTVQTPNGAVFDAIVIGEQEVTHWLAGSNNFQRTQPLGGTAETEAGGAFVAVAVTYAADGRIAFYRKGKPYGESYLSKGLQAYEAGGFNLSLGMRHSPGGGNKHLAGAISRVKVYDRALSPSEVALASDADPVGPTDEELLTELSLEEQETAAEWKRRMESLESRIAELEKEAGAAGDPWTALAHSFFNLKELIYLR